MAGNEPHETTNLDIYGNDPLPWSRAVTALDRLPKEAHITWFLGVTGPGGTPHAAGVGAIWTDRGEVYFVSGPGTRKSKHLAANPQASLSVAIAGIDLVFEGVSRRVTDKATLDRVVQQYREGDWPAEVEGDAITAPFNAPSAGRPPYYLYRLDYSAVYGVAGAEPYGATRWRFTATSPRA